MLPRSERPPSRVALSPRPNACVIVCRARSPRVLADDGMTWMTLALLCSALSCSIAANNATGPANGGGSGGGHATGSLAVTMAAPTGVMPSVTVSGPSGFLRTLTATQTLSGLTAGTYTIVATTSATADPIVGVPYSGSVTGSPATVVAGGTAAAAVAYAKRADQGLLWVSNYVSDMAGFTSGELAASGSPVANTTVNADGPAALAIDAMGGAWTTPGQGDTLLYYAQSQLLGGGTPAASVKIVPPSGLNGVTALALDAQGDLWVAGQYSNTLVEFTPDQITKSGSPTPAVTIGAVFGSLERPFTIAFDARGDLWAASVTDSTIVAYSPSQLTANGTPVPVAAINQESAASEVISIAFDSAGNLWAAGSQSVSEFAAKDLTSIGSPAPVVTVTLTHSGTPGGLAFDDSGNLWVSDSQNNRLVEYTPTQLPVTGTPAPAAVISATGTSLDYPAAIVFSPHATDLPLH
jgi:hypothetical protein